MGDRAQDTARETGLGRCAPDWIEPCGLDRRPETGDGTRKTGKRLAVIARREQCEQRSNLNYRRPDAAHEDE